MGDDIAALLNQLSISKADIVGLSLGAAVGLRTAIQHPDKVRRLVVISSPYAKTGWYPEAQEGMGRISAAMAEHMMQTPTGRFSTQWPEPQRFPPFLNKMGKMMGVSYDARLRPFRLVIARWEVNLRTSSRRPWTRQLSQPLTARLANPAASIAGQRPVSSAGVSSG